MKLKSLNPSNSHYTNFDSFEALNMQSAYALTTKNNPNNHIFSATQANLRNKDSFQFSQHSGPYNNRNGVTLIQDITQNDYNNESSYANGVKRTSNSNKIQQKIQKIIQATSHNNIQ